MPPVVRPIQLRREGGRLWPAMFKSPTLNIRCNVFVYTPPGIGRGTGVSPVSHGRDAHATTALSRLPVLYLLHGMWGSEIDWPFKGDAQAILDREILAGRVPPLLVAMPNDGLAEDGTFYSDWRAGGRTRRFERYVTEDLRTFIEHELTGRIRSREERMIAGLSMGGFGSLMLSLRRPDLYSAAASLSGVPKPIGDWRYPDLGQRIFGPFEDRPDSCRRRHDPMRLIEDGQRTSRLGLYLDCGISDGLLAINRKFHAKLSRLGIRHDYHEYAGAHDWPSWRKRLPHALRFLARRLT